jgi:hypothetical protein
MSTFSRVKDLRDLEDSIITFKAHCAGNLQILEQLVNVVNMHVPTKDALNVEISQYRAYNENLLVLYDRLRSTTDLVRDLQAITLGANAVQVGYTLSTHNQLETVRHGQRLQSVAESLDNVAQKGLADSGVTKALGIISVLYLPAGIVGVCDCSDELYILR